MSPKEKNTASKQGIIYEVYQIIIYALFALLLYYFYSHATPSKTIDNWENFETQLFFYSGGIFLIYLFYKSLDRLLGGELKESSDNFQKNFGLDIFVIRKIKEKPYYLLPFAFATTINIYLTYLLIFDDNGKFKGEDLFQNFFLLLFGYIFIYSIAFLTTGEILERENKSSKRPVIIELIKDIIFAFPYILLLILAGFLFVLIDDRDKKIKILGIAGLFTALKYFTYVNLTQIAYKNQNIKTSWKNSKDFIKKNSGDLSYIYFNSGATLAIIFLAGLNLFLWNKDLHWLHNNEALIISGTIFLSAGVISLFIEQISLLFYFIDKDFDEKNASIEV